MISKGIGREIIQTLDPIVLIQMSMGEPIKSLNYPFFLMHPIIYLFQNLVGVVNALGMERYGSQFCIGESHHFWRNNFFLRGQENTQKLVPKPFLTHVFLFLTQLDLAGRFPLTFACISFILQLLETHFCIAQWMGRMDSRFGSL